MGNASGTGERNRHALGLFAPLAPTYDRYARLFSFGQDPRWRRFLVSRVRVSTSETVLDVACGTAAVSIELVRRYGCSVVGVDQSPEMLAAGRNRVALAGLADRIDLVQAGAEALPFGNDAFDALTFTYLLRYVDAPAAVMRELVRVVRPGGTMAMLEFSVPPGLAPRAAWEAYVRAGLPAVGRVASPAWGDVGRFLGPSVRDFAASWPLPRLLELWHDAGVREIRARRLTFGGGLIVWGRRGD